MRSGEPPEVIRETLETLYSHPSQIEARHQAKAQRLGVYKRILGKILAFSLFSELAILSFIKYKYAENLLFGHLLRV
jgi:hypothetical protein